MKYMMHEYGKAESSGSSSDRTSCRLPDGCADWMLDEITAARPLFVQHCYASGLIGEILPQSLAEKGFESVLDVGCRTGDWLLEIARRYPQAQCIGVDKSEYCIGQAQALGHAQPNVAFLVKETEEILAAVQGKRRFDLVHLSFCVGELHLTKLSKLISVLVELCRPGGHVIWTETELPLTNSIACEQFNMLVAKTLQMSGSAPCPGSALGVTALMGNWLRSAGCRVREDSAQSIDVSRDAATHHHFVQHFHTFSWQMKPAILASGFIWEEAYDGLCGQVLAEIQRPDFCALCFMRTMVAEKRG